MRRRRPGAAACLAALLLAHAPASRPLRAQAADGQGRLEVEATVPVHRHAEIVLGADLRAAEAASNRRARFEAGAAFPWEVAAWLRVEPRYRFLADAADDGVEHRYSVEALVSAAAGPLEAESRSLLERRFEEEGRTTRYRNRLRVGAPLGGRGSGTEWFVYDEVYYGWPERAWTRNVAAAGLARALARELDVELAYLLQRDFGDSPRDAHALAVEVDWTLRP
ncbi:MAG TPA: DUF2490 domain-containing protein [Longimicrobiaceae bacterium]|nr:DUF2490 domain-containing protein [Longimicrobiaceae bacterium]